MHIDYPNGVGTYSPSNFRSVIENLYDFLPNDADGFLTDNSARAGTGDYKAAGIFGAKRVKLDGTNTLDDYASVIRESKECIELGIGEYMLDIIAYVHSIIPNTSHKSKFYIGLSTDKAGTALTDGVWFEYDENDTNWQCVNSIAGTETKTDSGVAIAAATKYDLKFFVNAAGTSIEFFVNGVSKATHTTNIPTVDLSPILYGRCTETHVEAASSILAVDVFCERLIFTNPR